MIYQIPIAFFTLFIRKFFFIYFFAPLSAIISRYAPFCSLINKREKKRVKQSPHNESSFVTCRTNVRSRIAETNKVSCYTAGRRYYCHCYCHNSFHFIFFHATHSDFCVHCRIYVLFIERIKKRECIDTRIFLFGRN